MFFILVFVVVAVTICVAISHQNKLALQERALEKEDEYIRSMVLKHFDTLNTKFDQLIYQDDYGNYKFEDANRECDYFVENVLYPDEDLDPDTLYKLSTKVWRFHLDEYEKRLKKQEKKKGKSKLPKKDILASISDPIDFENACKEILKDMGWEARTTKKSGDQGVDVIAKKKGITLAIQCKYYSKPVGNKAVQEVSAGQVYYKADYAAVVSNNTYTKSARQLAQNCNVLLLNIRDLSKIEKYLKLRK